LITKGFQANCSSKTFSPLSYWLHLLTFTWIISHVII
jgi:hypothetical protein